MVTNYVKSQALVEALDRQLAGARTLSGSVHRFADPRGHR
jgi:hypothetical protein